MSIVEDLERILTSRYGRDVRQSIHDAISDINDIAEDAEAAATTAQDSAASSATAASASATSAENSAISANNAKISAQSYAEDAERYAQSIGSALRPMGTVTFANLPSLASAESGDMYNVSDEFTTTADFVEGAGHTMPAGSNVYKTINSKWDVLAGAADSEANKLLASENIKNLLHYPWYAFRNLPLYNNESIVLESNNDGSARLKIDSAFTNSRARTFIIANALQLKKGRYIISGTYHYTSGDANNIHLTYTLTQDGTAESDIVPQSGKTIVVSGSNNTITLELQIPLGEYTALDINIYPMIRPESFGDDTFVPFVSSLVKGYLDKYENDNPMSGKNLIGALPYDTIAGYSGYTYKGVTYGAHDDGSISLSGATDSQASSCTIRRGLVLAEGSYILSGGCTSATIGVRFDNSTETLCSDSYGVIVNISSITRVSIVVRVPANTDVTGITLYPMIRKLGTSNEYVTPVKNPYEDRPTYYGICSTAASTAEKEVFFATPVVASDGTRIVIDFANANTATTPKMFFNNTLPRYDVKYKDTSGALVTYKNIPAGLQTFTFQNGVLIADGLVGEIEQINSNLIAKRATTSTLTTDTQSSKLDELFSTLENLSFEQLVNSTIYLRTPTAANAEGYCFKFQQKVSGTYQFISWQHNFGNGAIVARTYHIKQSGSKAYQVINYIDQTGTNTDQSSLADGRWFELYY